MSAITLTAAVRSNLLALQDTTANQATTQQRLATGKKVNSALDNPTNYFTAAALSARAGQLTQLLDSMTNGINTIKAASNGLDSITTTLQSMQATVTQARQDASWQSATYTLDSTTIGTTATKQITISGGAVGTTGVSVFLNTTAKISGAATTAITAGTTQVGSAGTLTIQAADLNGGAAFTVTVGATDTFDTVVANINSAAGATLTSLATTAGLDFSNSTGAVISVTASTAALSKAIGTSAAGVTTAVTSTATAGAVQSVDTLVTLINGTVGLAGKVRATNNAGQLQVTNLSTSSLSVAGAANGSINGLATTTSSIGNNLVRTNLISQFNQLKDQLDKTAQDASFNGINLLTGDVLKLFFNELSTSTLSIVSTNPNGVNSSTLGILTATGIEFEDNAQLDTRLQALQSALGLVASQASDFGSNLSIVQNRQKFTNNMINTLQTGADGLTLADTNLEGANMLALQTRQQLSITALSLASQANQSVLKLFG